MLRQEIDTPRDQEFITRALDMNRRATAPTRSSSVRENVCFHSSRIDWRTAMVASIDFPTVTVECKGKRYSTQGSIVRPYFGEVSIPPALKVS